VHHWLPDLVGFHENKPTVEMPLEVAWRTVDEHLQVIFPEWDVAQTFPESSSWRVDVLYGCSTGSNSLVDGPPWSVRNENDVDHLGDPILRAQVDRGFDTLVERGFEPVDVGPRRRPRNAASAMTRHSVWC